MIGVLHPCSKCGHESMDACWKASSELLARNRRMCLECHDDCLPRLRNRSKKSKTPRAQKVDPHALHRLLFASTLAG
jgi:hypothetical protein